MNTHLKKEYQTGKFKLSYYGNSTLKKIANTLGINVVKIFMYFF